MGKDRQRIREIIRRDTVRIDPMRLPENDFRVKVCVYNRYLCSMMKNGPLSLYEKRYYRVVSNHPVVGMWYCCHEP